MLLGIGLLVKEIEGKLLVHLEEKVKTDRMRLLVLFQACNQWPQTRSAIDCNLSRPPGGLEDARSVELGLDECVHMRAAQSSHINCVTVCLSQNFSPAILTIGKVIAYNPL